MLPELSRECHKTPTFYGEFTQISKQKNQQNGSYDNTSNNDSERRDWKNFTNRQNDVATSQKDIDAINLTDSDDDDLILVDTTTNLVEEDMEIVSRSPSPLSKDVNFEILNQDDGFKLSKETTNDKSPKESEKICHSSNQETLNADSIVKNGNKLQELIKYNNPENNQEAINADSPTTINISATPSPTLSNSINSFSSSSVQTSKLSQNEIPKIINMEKFESKAFPYLKMFFTTYFSYNQDKNDPNMSHILNQENKSLYNSICNKYITTFVEIIETVIVFDFNIDRLAQLLINSMRLYSCDMIFCTLMRKMSRLKFKRTSFMIYFLSQLKERCLQFQKIYPFEFEALFGYLDENNSSATYENCRTTSQHIESRNQMHPVYQLNPVTNPYLNRRLNEIPSLYITLKKHHEDCTLREDPDCFIVSSGNSKSPEKNDDLDCIFTSRNNAAISLPMKVELTKNEELKNITDWSEHQNIHH